MLRIVQLHGWEITLAYTPRGSAGESGLEMKTTDGQGIHHAHLSVRRYRLAGMNLNYQVGLLSLLRSGRWDAVFLEGAQANWSGYLAARWCRRHRIPCIWWTKGYFTPQNALRSWLHRLQLREPHAFLPYGDSTQAFLTQYGVHPEQIVRAYNTVDVERIAAQRNELQVRGHQLLAQLGWHQKRPLIASVGRLIEAKHVDDLLRATQNLHQLGIAVHVIVVGEGPERAWLETLIGELGIRHLVHFTGRVPEDDDSAILSVADVAVFCGALGLAINQAMALGVPVVVADLPGPDGEMVMHGQTGWRYPYRSVNELVQTLAEILDQGNEEVPQIVANAQEEILQRRNLTQYAQAFGHALQRAQQFLHR
jgi:glycosyltransferase involved in cell wall biosynthesis